MGIQSAKNGTLTAFSGDGILYMQKSIPKREKRLPFRGGDERENRGKRFMKKALYIDC
jgi:hypothetical protein